MEDSTNNGKLFVAAGEAATTTLSYYYDRYLRGGINGPNRPNYNNQETSTTGFTFNWVIGGIIIGASVAVLFWVVYCFFWCRRRPKNNGTSTIAALRRNEEEEERRRTNNNRVRE
mmetsp:Transcript_15517/g.23815  ORF Transcript_15517/g.23815 Transcript_15517/m.23815 type:complete len:115 (-) Transcript_15517:41-385(-)|eukprot:CAMPEP_0194259450 /NCGR_PEP_ID=MMETSP0158-20130606/43607_1 /TAXON_ID=33649 /ORGANISM="Thalassionema nitzschioides, Strain L26-B" /LENGTH=114 /DNA_ID=CAMNT_0038999247 /DNA_START=110 /DNA_END=454 /DNA_ORIENTATION=+